MPNEIVYLTAAYGEKYVPFILTFLQSLANAREPESRAVVLWDFLPPHEVRILRSAFPWCDFIQSPITLTGISRKDVPLKVHFWCKGVEMFPHAQLRLMDSDTVVVKNFNDLVKGEYDILYTYKKELYPLNTGVMVVNNSPRAIYFFHLWLKGIAECLANRKALQEAVRKNGAVDQHVLAEWLGTPLPEAPKEVDIRGRKLTFKPAPCSELNETRSRSIGPEVRVIHYKGGWQPILVENKDFSQYRSRDLSLEMYRYWMSIYSNAASYSIKKLVMGECAKRKEKFRKFNFDFQIRGILHSEMLIVCALCEALGIEVIIESGRCRGQSTYLLAKYFADSDVKIESIEINRDQNALYCEQRLHPFSEKVNLLYGDCRTLLPGLLKKHRGRKLAILFDGPKGEPALEIFHQSVRSRNGNSVVAGFFHDTKKGVPFRSLYESGYKRAFFSDDEDFVEKFREIDKPCLPKDGDSITEHTWRPYMKGRRRMGSYGPTLCTVLPLYPEKVERGSRLYPAKLMLIKTRSVAGRLKRFLVRSIKNEPA
ncbi:MAG: hypothetical protein JXQ83_07310 [Candidatus Glassbacteria bacterium]|nr:hypothetical protein [Candidatus Glassbacteria bacterium]